MSLEAFSFLDNYLADKNFLARATRIESFTHSSGSKFTLNLNNGQSKRISFRLDINDFLVDSILQSLKIVLPDKLYEKLIQDYLDIVMKCNIELARLTAQKSEKIDAILTSDLLSKLTQLIIAILTGDHNQFAFMVRPSQI